MQILLCFLIFISLARRLFQVRVFFIGKSKFFKRFGVFSKNQLVFELIFEALCVFLLIFLVFVTVLGKIREFL